MFFEKNYFTWRHLAIMTRERIAGGGTGSERRPNWKYSECFIAKKKEKKKLEILRVFYI